MPGKTSSYPKGNSLDADVVIVGAGPAGCGAAFDLAANGIRVLLLDRTAFPRRKTCAGGLTTKSVQALRYPIGPVVRHVVRDLAVSCRMHRRRLLRSVDPICYLVERSAFDRFCLEQTLAAGAGFAIVNRIHRIRESDRDVTLTTEQGLIRSRFLIGADGVRSRVRHLTGRFASPRYGFAIEGVIDRHPHGTLNMGFDFGQAKGGYGWVFPKGDHINVGLYTSRADVRITRRDLTDYAVRRVNGPPPLDIRGYPLGTGGWRYRPGHGQVLLVGDAAGLVEPLFGEGLYHAIASGQLAAAAIVAALSTGGDACAAYAGRLAPIQQDLFFARLAAMVFYRLPGPGHLLLTSPVVSSPLMHGVSQGMPLGDVFRQGHRIWIGRNIPARSRGVSF